MKITQTGEFRKPSFKKKIQIGIAAALVGLKRGTVWVDNEPREVVYLPVSIVAESQTVTEFEAGP